MDTHNPSPLTHITPGRRRTLQIAGLACLVVGITLVLTAVLPFLLGTIEPVAGSDDQFFERAMADFLLSLAMAIGGFVLTSVGAVMSWVGFMRPVSELLAAETSGAVAHTGRHAARGVGTGLAESGFTVGGATVVRVRCRACGGLDDEQARFCSACGQAL